MNDLERACFLLRLKELLLEIEESENTVFDEVVVSEYLIRKGKTELKSSNDLYAYMVKSGIVGKPILEKIVFESSILPSGTSCFINKKKYKVKGEVWVVHKNDVDPFPSSPHAHNYDQNLVMHLGNGNLYRGREFIVQAKRKDFLTLRSLIKNVELPKLEL
ncbi:hypothetical protein [Aeromonas schubertii]|uniref:hypothetical protein n=1 Tax=Aeromonas schubertii TaxID=652 RepID=UPI001CC6F7D2|nr:hypothetical protein [Aeromonas schubertii]MBZ6072942.1 hypothetical protein [Aeromonas schubertii]